MTYDIIYSLLVFQQTVVRVYYIYGYGQLILLQRKKRKEKKKQSVNSNF